MRAKRQITWLDWSRSSLTLVRSAFQRTDEIGPAAILHDEISTVRCRFGSVIVAAMFVGWGNYFFLVGSAAAALIGLMFIVVTLTAGRGRSELEPGKKLYTSPIVWHLGVVLLVSGGALAPDLSPRWFAVSTAIIAAVGAIYSVRVAVGIVRTQLAESYSGFDMWWYGIAPAVAYCGLGVSAAYLMNGSFVGVDGSAGAIMALLLTSIHNEWDLVTFLAPEATTVSKAGRES